MPKSRLSIDELDSPWKEALEHFLAAFLEFFFPKLHAAIDWKRGYEALDKEFQQIVHDASTGKVEADKLFKVWLRDGNETWILIHIEIQGQVDATFPERMFDYNVRARQLYHRPVIGLAVLCDDQSHWRPNRFSYGGWGCEMAYRFPVAKVLDYAAGAEALEGSRNPFAAVVLAHLKARETRRDPVSRYRWKTRLVRGLYERGWQPADVRQLFRLLDWLLTLPGPLQEKFREELHHYEQEKHMPYLSSIERMAKEEGVQLGMQKGIRQGLLLGIELDLEDKFGAPGLKLLPKIRAFKERARLEAMARAIKAAQTLAEIRRFIRGGET
jgi:hypothetical protein